MDDLPAPREPEPEVIEPEIVGFEPRPPLWRRLLARAALAAATGVLGLGLIVAGFILTLSIVGAPLGISLLLLGICLVMLAAFVLLGGGKFRGAVLTDHVRPL